MDDYGITDDLVKEYKEAFEIFDKDKDGFIKIKELADIMKILGQTCSDTELQDMMNEIDLDGNGSIDFREYFGLMIRKMRDTANNEEDLIESFKIFDRDGNGLITPNELLNVFRDLGQNVQQSDIDELIKEADYDGDGALSYDEFVKMIFNK